MKLIKKGFLATILLSASLVITACGSSGAGGNDSKEKDENTITLLRPDYSDVRPKSKDLWMWQEYEKMSGIHVEWEEVKDIGEKKNLILSRDRLPDALYQTIWSNTEIVKYGQQGLFIPLEDLIPEHAPNLQKLIDENPEIGKAITSPDGHIYALPYVSLDPMSGGRTFRMYINKPWLDTLGLEIPRTTEDLAKVLKAFVTEDPNGNGKNDEQGFYMSSGEIGWSFEKIVMAAYGLGTGGRKAIDNLIYIDKNGELQLTVTSDEYKEVWRYMNDLYASGAIQKQAFAGIDGDKWRADATKDVVGLWTWVSPEFIGPEVQDNYVPVNILEGPNGDKALVTDPPVMGTSVFIITKDAEDPGKLLEWVDFFYGEEGSEFGFLGKEGETYHVVDGKKVYVDEILNYENGVQLGSFQYLDNVYAGFFPYLEPSQEVKEIAWGEEPVVFDDISDDVMPEQMLPEFTATQEEANEISTIVTDLGNYIAQSRVDFITGKLDIDNDWDKYIAQLKKMGSDRLLEIRREQYERYQNQ